MDAEMLKGHLDLIVLATLEAGPAHGYAISEEIRRRGKDGFALAEGTLYPALHRLEEMRLLESRWETSPVGRRRRVYSLTRRGRAALAERRRIWTRFIDLIDSLIEGPARARADR
jgi:PadR family transcriptional regulator